MNYDGQQANPPVDGKTVYGGPDDDGPGKRYEIAISTRNLKWTNLAKYLELELGVQLPKDQKTVTVLNEHFVVTLPARLTAEQKQDIDFLRGSKEEVDEFFKGFEKELKAGKLANAAGE